jgi:hypothetical protein
VEHDEVGLNIREGDKILLQFCAEGGKEGEKEGEGWRDKIRKPHHRFKLITNITAIKNVFYAYGRNNTA